MGSTGSGKSSIVNVLTRFYDHTEGSKAELIDSKNGSIKWQLMEVCEMKQEAYKPHIIPGIIEAEDYDYGCPGDVYYDSDEINQGGRYRNREVRDAGT